jgi:hypothetical protein
VQGAIRFTSPWSTATIDASLGLKTPYTVVVKAADKSRHVSAFSDRSMPKGSKYIVDFKTKNTVRIKIGVSTEACNSDYAFSSYPFGWGLFLEQGAVRHNDNGSGAVIFPKSVFKKDRNYVSMIVDRIEGTLSFFANQEENAQVAFTDRAFIEAENLYVAMAIHNGDSDGSCKIEGRSWMDRRGLLYAR